MASQKGSLGGVPAALMNLMSAQMKLGTDLVEALTGQPMPTMRNLDSLRRSLTGTTGGCSQRSGSCHIPPPCWMPQPLGECTSHVSPCGTACVELQVTNTDRVGRSISLQATGKNADQVTFSPSALTLGPQERATIRACVSVKSDALAGRIETLIWVRGCREHYLRWNISVGTAGLDSCHLVEVCDGPDYVHHWYDHFYCPRPCTHRQADSPVLSVPTHPGTVNPAHG